MGRAKIKFFVYRKGDWEVVLIPTIFFGVCRDFDESRHFIFGIYIFFWGFQISKCLKRKEPEVSAAVRNSPHFGEGSKKGYS